ncbi:dTDP-4-dehydrorhamnose reductase [Hyphomonas sp. WL0036]|uniref:dTDP-4-dehydrorhamnose reductase n=1 Tax=Hyphomonas sediminis TaxID=2866160 RepID=UPI001C7FB005|nr:dTDP-4-dehydrorhamnose reductase [Hyphomonas sediminis]
MTPATGQILVIGRQGQLAQALLATGRDDLVCVGRPEADLANPDALAALISRYQPRLVLNAGGFTKVDLAESQEAEAFALNEAGPAALARLCQAAAIPLIHISTDCVFDGQKAAPYDAGDMARPLSVYGRSKLAGEQAVAQLCTAHLVVRVSWVFSEYADNFVRTMLKLAAGRDEITVVNDQIGYPTYCPDLAAGLLLMADQVLQPGFDQWGVYHLAGRQEIDRAAMAEAIFAESRVQGGPSAWVKGVATSDYPTPAARPMNARLDSRKVAEVFGVSLNDWNIGLKRAVGVLLGDEK